MQISLEPVSLTKLSNLFIFCFNYREAEREVLGREDEEEMLDGDKVESGSSDTEYTDSEEDTGNAQNVLGKIYMSYFLLLYGFKKYDSFTNLYFKNLN